MTQKEATRELHDRVRQCITRHRFETFGDILQWWHEEEFDVREMEAGEQGMSKFSTDLMWLVGQFGPKVQIDHKIMDVRKVPALKKVKPEELSEIEQEDVEYVRAGRSRMAKILSDSDTETRPKKTPRQKTRRRRF